MTSQTYSSCHVTKWNAVVLGVARVSMTSALLQPPDGSTRQQTRPDPLVTRFRPDFNPTCCSPFPAVFLAVLRPDRRSTSFWSDCHPFQPSITPFSFSLVATFPPLKTQASSFIYWFILAAPPRRSRSEATATSDCETNLAHFGSSSQIVLFSERAISFFHTFQSLISQTL